MTQSNELFSLSAITPNGSPLHGEAILHGSAQAGAEFRRGIDLSAGFDFNASVGGEIGHQLHSTFSGGVGVRGGLAIQAMFPLDLFTSAGVVARFRAQLEAAAYLRAALQLELDEFYRLLRNQIPTGPLQPLLELFLEEVEVEAGLWARAAFTAQIFGEATLTGSLLSSQNSRAGFSFSLQYGIGWIYGTGYQFLTNIGIEDPRRLLDRMASLLTDLTDQEINRYVSKLPANEAEPLQPAIAAIHMLIPFATRACFRLGTDLASPTSTKRSDEAVAFFVDSLVCEAQHLLLRGALEFASKELSRMFLRPALLQSLDEILDENELEALIDSLTRLHEGLADLRDIEITEVSRWAPLFRDSIPAFEAFLAIEALPQDFVQDSRQVLALGWAAVVLLERVVLWIDDPGRALTDVFGTSPVAVPSGSHIAAHVRHQLGKSDSDTLSLADMASLIAGANLEAKLRAELPALGAALDWLAGAFNTPSGNFARQVLIELVGSTQDKKRQVLATVSTAFSEAIRTEIVPKLIVPIKAADPGNKPLAEFLDEIVVPILVSVPSVIIPGLGNLDTPGMAIRFREALSSVLLQTIQRFVIGTVDVLLQHALQEGQKVIREVGATIGEFGEQEPAFALLTMAASGALLPISITPADAQNLLELSADIVDLWDKNQRAPLLNSIRILLSMGLSTEETREETFHTIVSSDKAAAEADLQASLHEITDGLWEMVRFAAPKLLELIALHYLNEAKAIAAAIEQGAKALVAAAEQAAGWLAQQIAELQRQLAELLKKIGELFARIAGDIRALADHLRTLVTDAVNAIRAAGFALVEPLIKNLPDPLPAGIQALYNALFDSVAWIASQPFLILSAVAGWVEDVLTGRFGTIANDENAIHQEVRKRIAAASVPDIHFDLRLEAFGQTIVNLGRVTLPSGTIAKAILDVVFGDGVYSQTVHSAAQYTTDIRSAQAQEQTIRKALAGTLDAQQAEADAAQLAPGQDIRVLITAPTDQSTNSGRAPVQVRLEGANFTFVQPTLGVPARVSVALNGHELDYEPEMWDVEAGAIRLTARVIPEEQGPRPVTADIPFSMRPGTRLQMNTGVSASISKEDRTITFVAAGNETVRRVRSLHTFDGEQLAGGRVRFGRMVQAMSQAGKIDVEGSPVPVAAVGEVKVSGGEMTVSGISSSNQLSFGILDPVILAATRIVRGSDGVPVLQGRLGLNALQVAVSDGKGHTESASVLFFLQPGKPKKAGVTIAQIEHTRLGGDLPGERIVIRSDSPEPLNLEGWTLRDISGNVLRLPPVVLQPGESITVWTGSGNADERNIYWGRRSALWRNPGDTAVLSDSQGHELQRVMYAPRSESVRTGYVGS